MLNFQKTAIFISSEKVQTIYMRLFPFVSRSRVDHLVLNYWILGFWARSIDCKDS